MGTKTCYGKVVTEGITLNLILKKMGPYKVRHSTDPTVTAEIVEAFQVLFRNKKLLPDVVENCSAGNK